MSNTILLEKELETYFGYSTFRVGQKEIISDVLNGKNVLGILPTGTGKSICYQLPARLLEGVTIVVSPLISLMMDQVKELKATNFKEVVALNSFLDYDKRKQLYKNLYRYKLIYVSPEMLQQKELQFYLKKMTVSLFVIDEAHCISQWGHEFRPDYQKLKTVINQIGDPPVLALSATATREVQDDIINSLERPICKHIYPMDRSNITLSIQEVIINEEKLEIITNVLSEHKVPSLIYFSSKNAAENVSHLLSKRLPEHRVAFYHGGMEQMDRVAIQQQFMNDQIDIVCCTSAFGMGINKNNIRFVFHYHFPGQIESYIQEIGRAGRDGNQSISVLLYCRQDSFLPQQMIESELPSDGDLFRARQLFIKYQDEDKILPVEFQEIQAMFEISEVQWRFISSQLEKHGIKHKNGIKYDESKVDETFEQIKNIRDERLYVKQTKLKDMMNWIHLKTCLREGLYTRFQNGYTKVEEYCCSNCGIHLQDFNPKQTIPLKQLPTWEMKLKRLLVVGESK
ncbi:ATP-dependent DNA helicase RecQ [Paucisalibacillus sp. EB02]|uniref:RecQ family ATP-dependent DNA helicase n=1 Tax=Paucisalibacillus sp. EB02 TaxID=1347087 RepID=UPI0004B38EC8|nr:RecQ family ATP-dependent DNA helicase [Paucisalibacillus sp. EB02]